VTNLIRKAHCVLAKPRWENGRGVNLAQHRAAADKARVSFLTVQRLDVLLLVEALRPLLLRKRIVVEPVQKQQQGQGEIKQQQQRIVVQPLQKQQQQQQQQQQGQGQLTQQQQQQQQRRWRRPQRLRQLDDRY
jgi:hypothetical protein